MNQTHPIKTSQLILLIRNFVLSSNQFGVTGYDIRWKICGSNLAGAREQSFLHNIQSSSRTHQPPTQWKQGLFLWQQSGQGVESHHSHPSSAKFKIQWSYTSTQPVCLYGTYWNNFILPLPPTYVPLPKCHILSGLIKETFYSLLISHMHTTWTIYFTFFDPIMLTLWRVPITKLIIKFSASCY